MRAAACARVLNWIRGERKLSTSCNLSASWLQKQCDRCLMFLWPQLALLPATMDQFLKPHSKINSQGAAVRCFTTVREKDLLYPKDIPETQSATHSVRGRAFTRWVNTPREQIAAVADWVGCHGSGLLRREPKGPAHLLPLPLLCPCFFCVCSSPSIEKDLIRPEPFGFDFSTSSIVRSKSLFFISSQIWSWAWWCQPTIPGVGELTVENYKCQASLDYIARPCLLETKPKPTKQKTIAHSGESCCNSTPHGNAQTVTYLGESSSGKGTWSRHLSVVVPLNFTFWLEKATFFSVVYIQREPCVYHCLRQGLEFTM